MKHFKEKWPLSISGYLILLTVLGGGGWLVFRVLTEPSGPQVGMFGIPQIVLVSVPFFVVILIMMSGFYIVQPNTAKVLTFLGRYVGTDSRQGLRWTLPVFISKQDVSQRLRNFESAKSKVNDATGNPIEIAGVIVWRITRPASAVFNAVDVGNYVAIQGEAAIRTLASSYPYGSSRHTKSGEITLLSHPNEITEKLRNDLRERVAEVGVDIVDARISHLAYAQEIAAAMLQRQQADALVDAREVIVDGAIGMVQMALTQLKEKNIVDLTASEKSALVSNLLVVLSGDRTPQPVVQVGESGRSPAPHG